MPAPAVARAVSLLRLGCAEEAQLSDVVGADLAQLIHITDRDAVQVNLHLARALIPDTDHTARAQPVGPEFLHQGVRIERGRALELVGSEHVGIVGARPAGSGGAGGAGRRVARRWGGGGRGWWTDHGAGRGDGSSGDFDDATGVTPARAQF